MLIDDADFQRLVVSQPANRGLVLWLRARADPIPGRAQKKWPAETPLVDRHPYALHTHPDLGSLLLDVAEELPGHYSQFAFGYEVITNPVGIVCAVAVSMHDLIFRLPEQARERALKLGGLPHRELDGEWVVFDAWGVDTSATGKPVPAEQKRIAFFRVWCEAAWTHVNAFDKAPE